MLPRLCTVKRSLKTSNCGKNSDTLGSALFTTYLFLPHFDVICDLLLKRSTWNLSASNTIPVILHNNILLNTKCNK